jgi:hypothetical protein
MRQMTVAKRKLGHIRPFWPIRLISKAISERLPPPGWIGETFEKVAHDAATCVVRAAGALADIRSPITGKRRTSVV